jgi:uncharacterized membrane protein YphA (DoxX/SURF4 family)
MAVLGVLTVLSTAHTQLSGSPFRHLFFSGLCLAGWLVGLGVQRQRGAPEDESLARVGSIALLGAAYLSSGLSKLVYGGNEWLSGLPLQAAILGQQGLVPDGWASVGRSWVVATPAATSFLSFTTVGLELAGPLMLVGPRLRRSVALGLSAMHLNIYVLTAHILYWESIVLLIVFGPPRRASSRSARWSQSDARRGAMPIARPPPPVSPRRPPRRRRWRRSCGWVRSPSGRRSMLPGRSDRSTCAPRASS